jgi:YjbE family integral membrane protein
MIAADFVSRIVQIFVINLALSGDNAVVIGMAARPLEHRQRRIAIAVGGATAVLLRIGLTWGAAQLLSLPALRLVGGAVLLWVAFRLLEENEQTGLQREATTLLGAIGTILAADLIMSLDNVLGVAAASRGDVTLLAFGLLLSMAVLMAAGGLFAGLMDRLWWLAYVGAGVIAWTAADMMQDDVIAGQWLALPDAGQIAVNALVAISVVAIGHRVHRHSADRSLTGQVERTPR